VNVMILTLIQRNMSEIPNLNFHQSVKLSRFDDELRVGEGPGLDSSFRGGWRWGRCVGYLEGSRFCHMLRDPSKSQGVFLAQTGRKRKLSKYGFHRGRRSRRRRAGSFLERIELLLAVAE
jgi:hypothetical protein